MGNCIKQQKQCDLIIVDLRTRNIVTEYLSMFSQYHAKNHANLIEEFKKYTDYSKLRIYGLNENFMPKFHEIFTGININELEILFISQEFKIIERFNHSLNNIVRIGSLHIQMNMQNIYIIDYPNLLECLCDFIVILATHVQNGKIINVDCSLSNINHNVDLILKYLKNISDAAEILYILPAQGHNPKIWIVNNIEKPTCLRVYVC